LLGDVPETVKTLRFIIADRDQSHFRGFGGKNVLAIKKLCPNAQIIIECQRKRNPGHLSLEMGTGNLTSIEIPGIL
jgi:hypothetical protein